MAAINQKGSFIRIVVSFSLCFGIICYAGYSILFKTQSSPIKDTFVSEGKSVSVKEYTAPEIKKETVTSESVSKVSSAISVASKAKVLGKVTEKFISPYTANTYYNSVYLKNSTDLKIDIKELLSSPLKYKLTKNGEPQVLILHTHATESFLSEDRDYYTESDASRSTDNSKNMVMIGNIVAEKLNTAGVKTLHDTTLHDYPSYNESYNRSSKTVLSYIKKYPSIKIVIDMHRDAITPSNNEKVKVTTKIDGKKAAQIMLVMGSQSGNVKNFPNYKENLKLAVRIQQTLEVMYPALARSISLTSKNYNESLTEGSVLIEMGTDANSLEEVSYSASLLGNALVSLFNTLV
ncbi:MAG: stage II sporulation protein P [Clostridia bacterium]|nr:stage II sporulation protein P [Clostridia bacterium]